MKMRTLKVSRRRVPGFHRCSGTAVLTILGLGLAGCATGSRPQPDSERRALAPCQPESVLNTLLRDHPGVEAYRSGSGYSIRIRRAMGEPLYVVDGWPLSPAPGGLISVVHPCEIARIRVLTEPADLAFYGLRGGNGVVLIKTKR